MQCKVAYEVSFEVKSLMVTRSAVFTQRTEAKKFKAKWPGATLRVVELCEGTGKITRRGTRTFGRRR